ncbi:MAG TPA: Rne/Rng family ribonuclease [Stellaceae bacterium]|jgi:ribonuclease E|nr:Rne/Rng family ribonuclease [Stellaceae bacterium]
MAKRMLIDAAHPEETRVVVLNNNRLEEFDFETSTKKQIKGNIYLAKVTRVEPSLQAAFVEYGGNRHGFLAFNEIHPDYYKIPVSDRMPYHDRAPPSRAEPGEEGAEELPGGDAAPRPTEGADEPEGAEADEVMKIVNAAEIEAERAAPAEAHDPDIVYERRDAAEEPGGEIGTESTSETEAEVAAAGGDGDAGDEPNGEAERHEPHEINGNGANGGERAPAEHENGGEETRPDVIETVGGDEMEEAQRQRARHYRHYKIQEVIKRRQIMLVQVTKEERGNKGAALTTFLSLAGRYCVLMPNTPRGGGVSRKITSVTDRRRLKDLMSDLEVADGMGVIVRTAGSERSKTEIKRDFEYLMRLWDDIRELTLKSTAPALIYEEGNLIKRSIRDLYTRDLEEVIVDGDEGYHTAKAFMKMLMPSHAKRVKPYRDPSIPLFHRYPVESQIDAIHSPTVQLRSGGYIVINPTEALVAIDVNSGRSTKERNIEETALKTNVEAAEEIARQLRLRDLAGLIVIDFIDMEEHRNQATVERKLKEGMRYDRARIQLGRISPFGLLELSRQRLRPSLLEASTQPCPHCNGTGHVRSTESTALHVLRAIEEEGTRRRSAEIGVAVPTAVALYVLNHKRDALVHAEQRNGFHVTISNDDSLVPPAFRLERVRSFTPAEIAALPPPVALAPPIEEEEEDVAVEEDEEESPVVSAAAEPAEAPAEAPAERVESEQSQERHPRRRRRRRGRRGEEGRDTSPPAAAPPGSDIAEPMHADDGSEPAEMLPAEAATAGDSAPAGEPGGPDENGNRKRRRRGRRGGRRRRREHNGEGGEHHPSADEARPVAEAVEYLPEPERVEDVGAEMAEAAHATPAPAEAASGADAIPVGERGDKPSAVYAPRPPAAPAVTEERPRTVASAEVPTHDVTGPPSNPKRGWWRRVLDS